MGVVKRDSFVEFILDQLKGLESISCRRMFGGYGLYAGNSFFGIIHDGRLYFKTNDLTRSEYIDKGMEPFRPSDKMTLKNYYEVPSEIMEDPDELLEWANEAGKINQGRAIG